MKRFFTKSSIAVSIIIVFVSILIFYSNINTPNITNLTQEPTYERAKSVKNVGEIDSSKKSSDLGPELFLNNIKEKIFKVKGHDDIYFDLSRKSITLIGKFGEVNEEEFFNFVYSVNKGSFINPNKKEYLFMIKIPDDELCFFFPHVENYGNTTLIYIFDENLNQLSDVFFQDEPTYLKDIIDINKDGLNEVIMESSYETQGCKESWLMIFVKNFDEPRLKVINNHDCSGAGSSGEIIILNSTYSILENKIIFNSTLDYMVCLGLNIQLQKWKNFSCQRKEQCKLE